VRLPLSWLAEYVAFTVEPRKLADDLTLAGLAVEGIETHGQETVLELDITTNRVDCMNVYGVAREVAVIYGKPLRPLDLTFREAGAPARDALRVEIEAGDLCPRFCARVLDVRLGPSPSFLRDRLEQVGVRPISNLVDLTNYVMMEMGHPSHAFDLALIPEGRLRIRWARAGERLTTLDGVERSLDPIMGVVAGPGSPLGLAGIMGGATSEVSEATSVVALEAAYWDPVAIRRTARALGMHTEASHRFERGADPEAPAAATARIAHLLEKIGAGRARPGLVEAIGQLRGRRTVVLRPARIDALLGTSVPRERTRAILSGLGFEASGETAASLDLLVPSWRGDVSREADVIEEVGRHHGLDKIPPTIPPARVPGRLPRAQVRERHARDVLVAAGLTEAINFGFTAGGRAGAFDSPEVALLNPLSSDHDRLRATLLPGLLDNLATNLRQGRRDVALFEIGRVFAPSAGEEALPREERRLAFVLTGASRPHHFSEREAAVDFFAAKGLVEALAARLDVTDVEVSDRRDLPAFLHPGRAATIRDVSGLLGFAGSLHPDVRAERGLRDEVVVAELRLDAWLGAPERPLRVRSLERFPSVGRDLSLLCDLDVHAADIVASIRRVAGPGLREVEIRDRYLGDPVPEGKVSLTLGLRFQDSSRTLTGEEVQAAVDRVRAELRGQGADVRGE
jgi:phenylalanyl-tRNA synthetase beta chain